MYVLSIGKFNHLLYYVSLIFTQFGADITDADTKLTKFTKQFGLFRKSFNEINNDRKQYGGLLAGIFETRLTKNDVSILSDYSKNIKAYNGALKEGAITQENYGNKINFLSNGLNNLTTAGKANALQIKALGESYASGTISAEKFDFEVSKLMVAEQKAAIKTQILGTALRTAFNVALSMGIGLLIQGITALVDYVIHYEENLIKRQEELIASAKNLTTQYNNTKKEADDLNKSSSDLINRYTKLAQGVDALGNNVSLTNEEYEEYKKLSNQIANDIPNLVKAYDAEGNAILKLRDNVDALKSAYQEAAKEKYSALLNSEDIKNALDGYGEFTRQFQMVYRPGLGVATPEVKTSDLEAMKIFEQILKDSSKLKISNEDYQKLIDAFDLDFDLSANHTQEEINDYYKRVSLALSKLKLEYSTYQASLDSVSNAILNIYDGFYDLPSELQTIANAAANNLPDSITDSLTGNVENDKARIANYIYSIVDSLNSPETAEQVTEAYKKIFEITAKDLPIAETQKQVEQFIQQIMKSTGMEEGVVKTIFGLDNLDNLSNQLDAVKQRFVKSFSFSNEEIRGNFFNGLLNELSGSEIPNTESEIKALAEAIDEVSQASGKSTDVLEVYRKKISEFNGIDPEKYDITETTKNLQEAYNALIEFRRALSDDEITTADIEKSIRSMAETYKDNAEVKSAAEKYFTTHTKEAAQDFLEVYKNAYLTDQNNFNTWLEEKRNVAKANENDTDAWDKFSASDFVEVFKDAYGIDLTNYTSYLDMKNKLTQQWLDDNGIDISKFPATSAVNEILKAAEDALNLDEIAAMYGSFFDSYTPYVPDRTDKKSDSTSDDTDKQYNKQLDKLKKASDGTQKAEEELIRNWINLNDTFYATSDPDKWAENYDTIGDYTQKFYKDLLDKGILNVDQYKDKINAFFKKMKAKGVDLGKSWLANALSSVSVDDAMSSWDLENGYDSDKSKNDFELRQKRIDEFRKQIVKAYGVDGVNNVKAYTDAMKEVDEQQQKLNEDTYAKTKEDLSADGDKTLMNVLSDAEELWNDTLSLFAGNDDVIKSNAKDIFGTVSSALEDALKKGIITVDGYESLMRSWGNTLQMTEADITDALVDTYEYRADALQKANDGSLASERKYIADMKALNFSTYGDENSDFYDPATYASNLRDITDHQLDVLKKALNNGEISVQEYANSVVEIFKDADILGADYVSEKLDDIDKVRAEREKTYWEQQKELMEDYYDKQIKEIEETQKAKEKENKLEELHLKLIKARQTLEEAKNNRNQLVFHDGTFEYMADQDAVMSAEEEVANTLKEIEDEKLQAQIDLLEEQKDAALGFYDQILDEIDFYLNKTLPLSESDQEELAKIRNSDYAQYARDKRDGNLTANSDNEKIAEDALNQTDTAEETKQSVSDIAKNVFDIAKIVANGFNFENLVRALGGNPTAEAVKNFRDSYNATLVGKQITPSTVAGVTTNNNSTNNNNQSVVFSGDINVNVELSLQSLDDFVGDKIDDFGKRVIAAIKQKMPAVLAKA